MILYSDNGKSIKLVEDENIHGFNAKVDFSNTIIVKIVSSFVYNFYKFPNIADIKNVIDLHDHTYGKKNNVLFYFNEILVDEKGIKEVDDLLDKNVYYANFDIMPSPLGYNITYPQSLYITLDYLVNHDFLSAKKFLDSMNYEYFYLRKTYKGIFNSNSINPVRIDIFNTLKSTGSLKDFVWSFNKTIQYYSDKKHNLDDFFSENEGLIPHSYDEYFNNFGNLKAIPFHNYLSYFEVFTESYFLIDVKEPEHFCPVTEKMVKAIISGQPIISFGSPNLKKCLENIGLTFNSPLYGFFDITDDEDAVLGIEHIKNICLKTKDDIHKLYYDNVKEYVNNSNVFINFFIENKKTILDKLK